MNDTKWHDPQKGLLPSYLLEDKPYIKCFSDTINDK